MAGWKKESRGGKVTEAAAADFNFLQKRTIDDVDYCDLISPIPDSFVSQMATVFTDDQVIVESVRLKQSVAASILWCNGLTATCTFLADYGDSGSLVWTNDSARKFVGFIQSKGTGCSIICIPNADNCWDPLPVPTPNPVLPVTVTAPVVSTAVLTLADQIKAEGSKLRSLMETIKVDAGKEMALSYLDLSLTVASLASRV